jgi:SAM-dependent methyltransferase
MRRPTEEQEMQHTFDKAYWEAHWRHAGPVAESPPNPHLAEEVGRLTAGTALDAGCGGGAEAIWLASRGWRTTAVDISAEVLDRAAARAGAAGVAGRIDWVEADLSTWSPSTSFDLVTTHYAHPAISQLELYDRLATWVAPRGTLLVVGHLQTAGDGGHQHPVEAAATADAITARLDEASWDVVTAREVRRTLAGPGSPGGRAVVLDDVVVRATRRATYR